MNSSARIARSEVVDLCETIHAVSPDLPAFGARALGLYLWRFFPMMIRPRADAAAKQAAPVMRVMPVSRPKS